MHLLLQQLCKNTCSVCTFCNILALVSVLELTSLAHHSCIIEIMCVSFICKVKAASHSGSISMCWPTCRTTGSIPCKNHKPQHITILSLTTWLHYTPQNHSIYTCKLILIGQTHPITCMHLSSSKKASNPSRNFSLSLSVHSVGRLIRTYLLLDKNNIKMISIIRGDIILHKLSAIFK